MKLTPDGLADLVVSTIKGAVDGMWDACLAAGILWEQSLRNLRLASRYVVALR